MAKSPKRKKTAPWFPCVIKELQPHDAEYVKGARFRVYDFDDANAYFVERPRMIDVLTIHGMMPVSPGDMDALRTKQQRTIQVQV